MAKRLLLVDDEEFFLQSLKDGLEPLSDVFETDICHSVNEAIKHVITHKYDLLITDIRMPGKSGIDLLIYLRDMKFTGKVMVMSAYNTMETSKQIKSLGAVDVISKPFKLNWFKTMVLEKFGEERAAAVTFESIDLVTVMQIINMEKKTSALEVTVDGKVGMIYFLDGEVIHSEFDGLEGEPAVLKLITFNEGVIAVKKAQGKIRRTIEIPFVQYMMNIVRTVDEMRRDMALEKNREDLQIPPAPAEAQPKQDDVFIADFALIDEELPDDRFNESHVDEAPLTDASDETIHNVESGISADKEEIRVPISEILDMLSDVNGYLGAGVFSPQGELLEGTTEISGIHFEQAGSLIHDALTDSKKMCREIGFGNLEMLLMYTEIGIIFAVCSDDGKMHFHTILIIKTDGNIAMAKLKMKKVVDALKMLF